MRALKAIVRIQALVRGRQVRKQAAITLKCMHALVRVQARVRARRAQMSAEGLEANDTNWQENTDTLKDAQVCLISYFLPFLQFPSKLYICTRHTNFT